MGWLRTSALVLVGVVVAAGCTSGSPEQTVTGGRSGPGPTPPPPDALTRPLGPGTSIALNTNVVVVRPGDDPTAAGAGSAGVIRSIADVAAAPDGSVYVADNEQGRIVRFAPDGTAATVAGTDRPESTGDGGPAIEARVEPFGVAVAPDGTVWVSDRSGLRHIDGAGIITTVVPFVEGGSVPGPEFLAGTTAGAVPLPGIDALAIGADGRPLVAVKASVYRLEANLTLTHLAGTRSKQPGDGGPATSAGFYSIGHIAPTPDGRLVLVDDGARLVRVVGADGIISTWGGVSPPTIELEVGPFEEMLGGMALGPDGSVIVTVKPVGQVVRVTPSAIEVTPVKVSLPGELATLPDGTIVIGSSGGTVVRVSI